MCPERELDCAVIDEIQMINDPDRGWAWTQVIIAEQTTVYIDDRCDQLGEFHFEDELALFGSGAVCST